MKTINWSGYEWITQERWGDLHPEKTYCWYDQHAVTIDELVERIINSQIEEQQFINSDITFRDINVIKKIFKKRLMNIYHVRIEYPR